MELIFNLCSEFWWSLEGPFSQIRSPHLHAGAPGKVTGPHLFIPSKTATLVPEFAVEDMPLGRTAALVPEFAVKDLSLGRILKEEEEEEK